MILHINTADLKKIVFTLTKARKVISQCTHEMPPHSTHTTLKLLETFLKQQGWSASKKPAEITSIQLFKKEGSPTGLRLGSAIAQGLSMAWGVPVQLTDTLYSHT
ncbi:MAG: hypothetical protein KBD66_00805 [Candidatus Doudnabacteria bacterium]|nr:hypothetical protein [Candidatus Doudnabacteria bacterium]